MVAQIITPAHSTMLCVGVTIITPLHQRIWQKACGWHPKSSLVAIYTLSTHQCCWCHQLVGQPSVTTRLLSVLFTVGLTLWVKIDCENEVDINRHFQASWGSQPAGCLFVLSTLTSHLFNYSAHFWILWCWPSVSTFLCCLHMLSVEILCASSVLFFSVPFIFEL